MSKEAQNVYTEVECDDGDLCTDDKVDALGACFYTPKLCDDGDPCTNDVCISPTGCSHPTNTSPCESHGGQ